MEQVEKKWTIEGHEVTTRRVLWCVRAVTYQEAEDKVVEGKADLQVVVADGYESVELCPDGDLGNVEVEINGIFVPYQQSKLYQEEGL